MGTAAIVLMLAGLLFGADPLANASVLGVSGIGAALIYIATKKARIG